MKIFDMRFDEQICREMIGSTLHKYRCDRFDFTNSVTQIIGVYIGDKIYALTNMQEMTDYFGNEDDIAIFKMAISENEDIKSAFRDQEQIDTPVLEQIKSILLVNDCQRIFRNGVLEYEVYLTRAIIFILEERQVLFEKDSVPFSEEIITRRGRNLIDTVAPETEFLEGWNYPDIPECTREMIEIRS